MLTMLLVEWIFPQTAKMEVNVTKLQLNTHLIDAE